MKCHPYIISIVIGVVLLSLCALPVTAQFQVVIAPGAPGAVTITDNGVGDTDPRPDRIGFDQLVALAAGSVNAKGHAAETITAKSIEVRFDGLQLDNPSAVALTTTIQAQSKVFLAVGPPFTGRVHLDGAYSTDKAGIRITNAQITLNGSVVQPAVVSNWNDHCACRGKSAKASQVQSAGCLEDIGDWRDAGGSSIELQHGTA